MEKELKKCTICGCTEKTENEFCNMGNEVVLCSFCLTTYENSLVQEDNDDEMEVEK